MSLLPAQISRRDSGITIDAAGVVGRSDIVLERPNRVPAEAMPFGNGSVGASVWAARGMTVQLNRADTMPKRLSSGQVELPGLARLTDAADYQGRLDLYHGEFVESGAGMTAKVYVQPDADLLVIDVTGADPLERQSADLHLWAPRKAHAAIKNNVGLLSEAWMDDAEPFASGRAFGSLAGITAEARDLQVTSPDPLTVRATFRPKADGSFRILVPAPRWDGSGPTEKAIEVPLERRSAEVHTRWWRQFWQHTGLIRIDSPDGVGAYMENLRTLYLFYAVADRGDEFPGSQAGIGDMLSAVQDVHHWDPAAFWHWNLRMQIAANLKAGHPELNEPYFRLYRGELPSIEKWTREHMAGRPGICVPETMRFNGAGLEYETWNGTEHPVTGLNCDANSQPYYNARTISTGAEVSFWIWQQYLATGDRAFLVDNYPVMRAAAKFLMAFETPVRDSLRHTVLSNAHETQWDVTDPMTDVLARMTLYPETMKAAEVLHEDPRFVEQLRHELTAIPELPRTQVATVLRSAKGDSTTSPAAILLAPAADSKQEDVFAASAEPSAEQHNVENLGLEPVWPWGLIGDDAALTEVARRTWGHRPYPTNQDWSFDPIQAARLGLGEDVASTLQSLTEKYQQFANGLANWGGDSGEFYIEQSGVVATALAEALAQDYDGVLRIAPAVPRGWNMSGRVSLRGGSTVTVITKNGKVESASFNALHSNRLRLRNPWPGESFEVIDEGDGTPILHASLGPVVAFNVLAGHSYRFRPAQPAGTHVVSEKISGERASEPRRLGKRQIGLAAPFPAGN